MKKIVISGLAVLSLAGCWRQFQSNPDPNHTHADFAVWINGDRINFSQDKYMSGLSTDESTHDEADEAHHAYFHLHDGNGDVIHRHKPDLTIGEFFDSLGFHMQKTCFRLDTGVEICNAAGKEWKMFVNAELRDFDPAYAFQDMDHILLTYGATEEQLKREFEAMTDDACKYSKTCPWKGDPPTENCIADPAVPCIVPEEDL